MNAGACRIQGELPNRNTHAIGTKITEAERPFAVGNHNHLYIPGRPILQNSPDPAGVFHRNENTAWATENVPIFLACQANRWRIDNGHHFFQVIQESTVEQRLVAILQSHQEYVALEIR